MNIRNQQAATAYVARRAEQRGDQADAAWIEANRGRVVASAVALHRRLVPGNQAGEATVLATVMDWAFQNPPSIPVHEEEESELSMVDEGPRQSFLEIQRRLLGDH